MLRGLSEYRVLGRLGSGGQGDVYVAFDTRLKRRVCIKLYHLSGSIASRRSATAEARHLMQVDSTHTLSIYDVVSAGTRLALVVQYVPGCTLEELLAAHGSLSPENAVAIVSDLAVALAALRRSNVVHGDIKGANVLIDSQGRAVLGDFGASLLVGDSWSAYSSESLSPEQSRGESATLAGDFFALGLLLYRMLYGEHPFYQDNALDSRRLRAGLSQVQAVPSLQGVSPAAMGFIENLLRSLLAADANTRLASTFDLRERLRELRSCLPAPTLTDISFQDLSKWESASNLQLPRTLVKLPPWLKGKAWLSRYWSQGSFGARGLLLTGMAAPLGIAILLWFAPGPCIAIAEPQISIGRDAGALNVSEQALRSLLSSLVKDLAGDAVVLGAGPDDDSRYTLSAAGVHNRCVAQQKLLLQLDCDGGRCLVQLRGESGAVSHERQLSLPQSASIFDLKRALSQLLRELSDFSFD